MKPEDYRRILETLDELVKHGCHCDVMYGYQCGIHEPVAKMRRLLAIAQSIAN